MGLMGGVDELCEAVDMNELSLFSGYGGFSLGLRLAGITTRSVAYVEWAKYPQEIIKARIKDGYLDDAPIWGDISAFDGTQFTGLVDIITGGFPCQPHSVAGKQRGAADERNLWPDTLRVIREVEPRYVLLENVPGLISASSDGGSPAYGGTVVGELASLGYSVHWQTIGADDVGAPHRRKRWWCIAVANTSSTGTGDKPRASGRGAGSQDVRQGDGTLGSVWPDTTGADATVADSRSVQRPQVWGVSPLATELQGRESDSSASRSADGQLADSEGRQSGEPQTRNWGEGAERGSKELADSDSQRGRSGTTDRQYASDVGQSPQLEERHRGIPTWPPGPSQSDEWARILAERPDLSPALTKDALAYFRGMDDGRSRRVDELKALGNGIVPAVVAEFLRRVRE